MSNEVCVSQVVSLSKSPSFCSASSILEANDIPVPSALTDALGAASQAPADAEMAATLHMRRGILVGAFVLDLPKIKALLLETAADVAKQSGLSVQALAQASVRATGTMMLNAAYNAGAQAQRAAWSTTEACVVGAWRVTTWPMRTVMRAVLPAMVAQAAGQPTPWQSPASAVLGAHHS